MCQFVKITCISFFCFFTSAKSKKEKLSLADLKFLFGVQWESMSHQMH